MIIEAGVDRGVSGQPEKNQGMRVVLDVTKGLWGHTIFCDIFLLHMPYPRTC